MAHEIDTGFDEVVSRRGTEWHGLAKHEPDEITFEKSGLTFRVDETPIYFVEKNDRSRSGIGGKIIDGWKGLTAVRYVYEDGLFRDHRLRQTRDSGKTSFLGVVKDSYKPIQNVEIWETVERGLRHVRKDAWNVATSGSIQGGKRVFVSVKLEESEWELSGGDKYRSYLSFTSGHDGTLALEAGLSGTRNVCSNTFHAHLEEKRDVARKVVHSGAVNRKLLDMAESVRRFAETNTRVKGTLEGMRARPVSEDDARRFAVGYFDKWSRFGEPDELAEKVFDAFKNGKGNEGKTRYDLYNGFTDYYTHDGYDSNPWKKFASSEFGWRAQRKAHLFDVLASDRETDGYVEKGKAWLESDAATRIIEPLYPAD